jgi:hypothetical protein
MKSSLALSYGFTRGPSSVKPVIGERAPVDLRRIFPRPKWPSVDMAMDAFPSIECALAGEWQMQAVPGEQDARRFGPARPRAIRCAPVSGRRTITFHSVRYQEKSLAHSGPSRHELSAEDRRSGWMRTFRLHLRCPSICRNANIVRPPGFALACSLYTASILLKFSVDLYPVR